MSIFYTHYFHKGIACTYVCLWIHPSNTPYFFFTTLNGVSLATSTMMNAFTSGCIHIKQAGLLDSKIALSWPHLALCVLWVLLPLRHSCNFGSFLFQFEVWDVLQSCCLVFSWNEPEILRFGLVCMTWQDRSPWVCKACREDAGELCRAEENRPGAFLSILPAGRYSQSWISKTEHFDFSFKWATQYFQKIHGSELIFIQYGGSVNQDQRWGVRWWCRPAPTPVSVCKLEWFSGHRDVWENTGELQHSNAVTATSALRVPALVKTDPELQL